MTDTVMFGLEWSSVTVGVVLVIVLFGGLLVPFLIKENRSGKWQLGPIRRLTKTGVVDGPLPPRGIGDNNPGRVGDPAPGQPDGQADPYSPRARAAR